MDINKQQECKNTNYLVQDSEVFTWNTGLIATDLTEIQPYDCCHKHTQVSACHWMAAERSDIQRDDVADSVIDLSWGEQCISWKMLQIFQPSSHYLPPVGKLNRWLNMVPFFLYKWQSWQAQQQTAQLSNSTPWTKGLHCSYGYNGGAQLDDSNSGLKMKKKLTLDSPVTWRHRCLRYHHHH